MRNFEGISEGANLNASTDGLWGTPLFTAAENGHAGIVQYLLQQPNIQMKPYISSASLLRKQYANVHEAIDKMEALIQIKLQRGENEEHISILPDEMAYIMGHDEIVRVLNEYKKPQAAELHKIAALARIDKLIAENLFCFFNKSGKLASDLVPVKVDIDPPKYVAGSQLQSGTILMLL